MGLAVGLAVGLVVGEALGEALGAVDGLCVGATVGLLLGRTVGENVGGPHDPDVELQPQLVLAPPHSPHTSRRSPLRGMPSQPAHVTSGGSCSPASRRAWMWKPTTVGAGAEEAVVLAPIPRWHAVKPAP